MQKQKRERDLEAERARCRAKAARWREKNPEKAAAATNAYRARRRAALAARKPEFLSIVRSSVPTGLPRHVREDIISSVVLSALEGEILSTPKALKDAIRRFTTAYYRMYDTYKTKSLDAVVPGSDNLRLIDTIAAYENSENFY